MKLDADVMIAGAGPVGLALTNLLGIYGIKAILVEARSELIDYPRGVGMDDESMRTLQTIDLIEEITSFTIPHHVMRLVNGHGDVILTNDPKGQPFGWPRKHGFIQPLVDKVMYEGLARFSDVEVRFNHRLVGIADRGDHIEATLQVGGGADGSGDLIDAADAQATGTTTVTARYLVGTEGGRSFTREWMGATFEGKSPPTRWVVVDVRNDPLGVPNVYLGADPARPYVSIGLPHAIRRWEFMLFDDEPTEKVEDDAFVAELLKDHVPDSGRLDVIRRRVFTHHGRIANTFRKGRVLIAGDAAHLMPVWMGQGWNSGIRDATNLAWKLATVLREGAADTLLDTYTAERHEHAKAMIDLSMTLGTIIKPTDKRIAAVRDGISRVMNLSPRIKEYFTDMRFKPMPRYSTGVVVDSDSLQPGRSAAKRSSRFMTARNAVDKVTPVGKQFIQPRVRTHEVDNALLDDVLGNWWAVAAWGNDPARLFSDADNQTMDAMGFRRVAFISETQRVWAEREYAESGTLVVGDIDGSLKKWFDTRAYGVVFLRPDRFVAAATLAQQAPLALAGVLTALSATPAPAMAPS